MLEATETERKKQRQAPALAEAAPVAVLVLAVAPVAAPPVAASGNLRIWKSENLGICTSGNMGIWDSGNLKICKFGIPDNREMNILNIQIFNKHLILLFG